MRRAARIDTNHEQIVAALRATGWVVQSLAALGNGVPDLLAWNPRKQQLVLVEVKTRTGKLTPDQQQFCGKWPVKVVRTEQDAIELGRF